MLRAVGPSESGEPENRRPFALQPIQLRKSVLGHENRSSLLQSRCRSTVRRMSTVELAVRRVQKLSARQARELLGWLDEHQGNGSRSDRPQHRPRQSALARRKQKLREWYDSVRGTTDWEPPRMPDDLVWVHTRLRIHQRSTQCGRPIQTCSAPGE
jgi:hypothetical protein